MTISKTFLKRPIKDPFGDFSVIEEYYSNQDSTIKKSMHTVLLKLDPARLTNPDLDIRYVLPDLLAQRSEGVIEDDGYDYESGTQVMMIYLRTTDLERALFCINQLVEDTPVLGNDLREVVEIITDPEKASD